MIQATGSMTFGRYWHTATLLLDGRVLVVGGFANTNSGFGEVAEIYAPATGSFATTGTMITPRAFHTATLLPDGRVLVTGGFAVIQANGVTLASTEIYDPATGNFTSAGTMIAPRESHTATALSDGKILIAGGFHNVGGYAQSWVTAELYEPASGFFVPVGSMATPRGSHTTTRLQNGKVLVAGGDNCQGLGGCAVTSSGEVYDPATNMFISPGNMTTPRYLHASTLLPNGTVLITGGYGASFLDTAEIY